MKKILSVLLLVIILSLTGCIEKNGTINHYIFRGENENWTAEYRVDAVESFCKKDGTLKYSNKEVYRFQITYKNDISELASLKKLTYSYDTGVSKGESSYIIGYPPKNKIFSTGGGSNGSMIDKDAIIQVCIGLDGKTQKFELKSCTASEVFLDRMLQDQNKKFMYPNFYAIRQR